MLISLARVAFYLLVKTEEVELLACEIVSINVHAPSRTRHTEFGCNIYAGLK